MLPDVMNALIMSFIATIGFAGLLHAPVRGWIPASLIGCAGYVIYWLLLQNGVTDPNAIFVGSCIASLLAQFAARRLHMIATIFSVLAIIPCVPGYGLYRCMFFIGQGQLSLLVSIRDKRRRGEKLEPWEESYYRQNKAAVELQSEPGKGTAITVRFP